MINNATLMGRLTADPELKKSPSGISVVTFSLAVSRPISREGEERPTDFITCVAWRGTAEFIVKYFRKGQMLAVVGAIQTHNYEDKNGNKRKYTEVRVREASFCGNKEKKIVVEPSESAVPAQSKDNAPANQASEYERETAFLEPTPDPPFDERLEEDFFLEEDAPF